MWGAESGYRKLMADDHDFANEVLDGITCEMYMRVRKFLEFGCLAFHPNLQTAGLFKELSGRRFQPSTKGPSGKPRIKLEPKREFKKRLGWSPDIADALVMLAHGCSLNGPEKASMIGSNRAKRFSPGEYVGHREKTAYIDWSEE
jgi:hypothetical protein